MGKYFNPPNDESLVKAGRKLDYDSRNYSNLKALLKEGEILVGLFDRGINKVAPFLPDKSEYEEFMKQYRSGQFIDVDFYAVIEKTNEVTSSDQATITSESTMNKHFWTTYADFKKVGYTISNGNYEIMMKQVKNDHVLVGIFNHNNQYHMLGEAFVITNYSEFLYVSELHYERKLELNFWFAVPKINIPKVQNNDMQYRLMNAKQGEVIRIK